MELSPLYATQVIQIAATPPAAKRHPAEKYTRKDPWKQEGSKSPVIDNGEVLDEEYGSAKEVSINRDGIEMAVEQRVSLFFQQALCCYKMPFHFACKGAEEQLGSSPAQNIVNAQGTFRRKREAAHSSTVPCLLAYPKQQWDAYTSNPENVQKPRPFVYLKGSYAYHQHNATIGMGECVNGADERIDGRTSEEGKLRTKTVAVINALAQGCIDPIEGTKRFLNDFHTEVLQQIDVLPEGDRRRGVLRIYKQHIEAIQMEADDPAYFDRLLCVQIDPNDPQEPVLRRVVYQERLKIIRFGAAMEMKIAKRIEAFKQGFRQKSYAEFMIMHHAIGRERKILERLFGKTVAVLEEEYAQTLDDKDKKRWKRFQTSVKNLSAKQEQALDVLMRDLRQDFRELFRTERLYRSTLFRNMRNQVRAWTQRDFTDRFKEKYPREPMSSSTVSRLEQMARPNTKPVYQTPLNQRRKEISIDKALQCADTLRVDPGLFLPALFATDEV